MDPESEGSFLESRAMHTRDREQRACVIRPEYEYMLMYRKPGWHGMPRVVGCNGQSP